MIPTIPLEIEVKFHIADVETLRKCLIELGAESSGRMFERNIRFEDPENSLFSRKSLLRLRQDAKARLTFKSDPPETEQSKEFKVFRELEVEVSDFSTMNEILVALGFHDEQVYEKYRETFVLGETHFCLDAMPFGDFLEIEGPKTEIREMAHRLDLRWERRILSNYLAMFEELRQAFSLPFSDVTFENFSTVQADFADCFHHFEAGCQK
ncbi:hypothetical protein DENIS_0700 [Desulfonema ishimotonii]|uniref:CYTH domain-containing protein n=1 Tax=Desulfonema ishimotonii TaxID=45657 RepID=A0A401FS10_9BACT|nr:class IV adenylate cyclase [Desulfonema ishimotonii]GBC59759.1 hypothetical protein DENIS_0700 [Desulfonema ishimotonii]